MCVGRSGSNRRVRGHSAMNESIIATEVFQIAAETFEVPRGQMGPESSRETIGAWDSVQHLNFILALEAKYNIEFSAEEMENIYSVADAINAVKMKADVL
jgi:acyl carrier protein